MEKIQPPYRNEQNQRYTRQLFYEQWSNLPIENRVVGPAFTLFQDREGLINFGKEYINDNDPTGYTTATRLLGEYAYWKFLMKVQWFREAKEIWDEELDAKLTSEGLAKIRQIALSEDKGALVAAKYLANQDYKNANNKKSAHSRGRPSKEEVAGHLAQEAREAKETLEDAERIKLVRNA